MPQKVFIYTQNGEEKYQYLVAHNIQAAKQILLQQGIIPNTLKPITRIKKHKHYNTHLCLFTQQLATLLQTGITLSDSLILITEQLSDHYWRYVVYTLKKAIHSGQSFTQALTQFPSLFPVFYQQTISTAEISGQLGTCCQYLAEQLDANLVRVKKIRSALRYPAFILSITLVIAVIMILVVLPRFVQLYQDFGAELPFITQCLLSIADTVKHLGLLSGFTLILLSCLYFKKRRKISILYHAEQSLFLRLPLIKSLIHHEHLTRFFYILSITQQVGVSLMEGLENARQSMSFTHYQNAASFIYQQVEQGISLSQSLKNSHIFPPLAIQLVYVGEQSGTLAIMLNRLAIHYQKQTSELADALTKQLEPWLMILLAFIVGVLAFSIYLPILQLGNRIG